VQENLPASLTETNRKPELPYPPFFPDTFSFRPTNPNRFITNCKNTPSYKSQNFACLLSVYMTRLWSSWVFTINDQIFIKQCLKYSFYARYFRNNDTSRLRMVHLYPSFHRMLNCDRNTSQSSDEEPNGPEAGVNPREITR